MVRDDDDDSHCVIFAASFTRCSHPIIIHRIILFVTRPQHNTSLPTSHTRRHVNNNCPIFSKIYSTVERRYPLDISAHWWPTCTTFSSTAASTAIPPRGKIPTASSPSGQQETRVRVCMLANLTAKSGLLYYFRNSRWTILPSIHRLQRRRRRR